MFETPAELHDLQVLLDRSWASSSSHLDENVWWRIEPSWMVAYSTVAET